MGPRSLLIYLLITYMAASESYAYQHVLQHLHDHNASMPLGITGQTPWEFQALGDGPLHCSASQPCVDKSCCGKNGICGFGPDYCGSGCINGCDATAMCGKYSQGGSVKCGLNLCCSNSGWCGTTANYCTPSDPTAPCQQGFGSCSIKQGRTCGTGSGTTNSRTVGYYQGSNTWTRACNRVTPANISSKGYTHLYYAFAAIDPNSFAIMPASDKDSVVMKEFTQLKSGSLQTWVAVGGFDFSDAGTPTHNTWSKLVSTQANRASFIQSAMKFMASYGFQGIDIDWEYPVDSSRGGSPGDTQNFVSLVKEMRAAFGNNYGISVTLAPDFWYLRYFDPKAMEPYVNWFGFMGYDLHGPWDSNVPALGSLVRGQTDIRDISNDVQPLWFDDLDPSKINLGLALYGRGYTLQKSSCNTLLCPFSGPSKPGICTGSAGVMSLLEIEGLIQQKSLTPKLLGDSMMKQITWDDQWIGYDDADTIAMKKAWANNYCFGGTMTWSVDFNSGNIADLVPIVTTDGTCGPNNGGAVCGGEFGKCCSAGGYCGNSLLYCGSGCVSGECAVGGLTTDGTCGSNQRDFTCGLWAGGSCCSASGYCGSGPAYCGPGCQSGCDNISPPTNCAPGFQCKGSSTGGTDDYTKVDCTNPVITDAATNPADRWTQTYAEEAWAAAVDSWNAKPTPGGLTFPEQVSNFFHGPEGMNCGNTNDHNGCGTYSECSDTNYPAGYLILNSMVTLESIILSWYDAIVRVESNLLAEVSNIAATFAPVPQEPDGLKIALDIIQMGYAIAAAGVWNSALKGLKYFEDNPNTLGVLADSVNGIVGAGIALIKDLDLGNDQALSEENSISQNVGGVIQIWYNAIDQMNQKVWDGSSDSINVVHNLVQGGQLLENAFNAPSDPEIQNQMEQAIFSSLIPNTWSLSENKIFPVIIDVQTKCGPNVDFNQVTNNNYIDPGAINDWTCVNGNIYYLIGAQGDAESCTDGGDGTGSVCSQNSMTGLPGLGSLNGKAWGGITKDDLINGAINTYTANGNQNGASPAQPASDLGSLNDILKLSVTAPGVVIIPVCTAREAVNNWGGLCFNCGPPNNRFPCN